MHNRYYEKIGKVVKDITDEIDFELPGGWELVRLSTICWLDDIKQSSGEKTPIFGRKNIARQRRKNIFNKW